jgi:hypothetical protein
MQTSFLGVLFCLILREEHHNMLLQYNTNHEVCYAQLQKFEIESWIKKYKDFKDNTIH